MCASESKGKRNSVIRLKTGTNYFPFVWKKGGEGDSLSFPALALRLLPFQLPTPFHPGVSECVMDESHVCTHTGACICNHMHVQDKRIPAK